MFDFSFIQCASSLSTNPRVPPGDKKEYSRVVAWAVDQISKRYLLNSNKVFSQFQFFFRFDNCDCFCKLFSLQVSWNKRIGR